MSLGSERRPRGTAEAAVGWAAAVGAGAALLAWISCCVLPIALSLAGLSLAGTAWLAGQRTWLTFAALAVLALGWVMTWRRRRACARASSCAVPSRLTVGLLTVATLLTLAALAWQPLLEPRLLAILRTLG
ncbi:MAG: MFS transporter permease [Phenylobacterium sp.]|nr:MAG: MFS transporter permease [Phenylobacterium sp.]